MQKMALTSHDVVDPLWTVIREGGPFHARLTSPGQPGELKETEAYFQRLEKTDRADAARELREKYARMMERFSG